MPKSLTIFNKLSDLRRRFYAAKNGKDSLLEMINQSEVAEHVYNSNAIENSTLTLEETEKILLDLELDRSISNRELFEAKNLARVVKYISTKAETLPLTLEQILLLHQMLLTNIRDDIAGRFRIENEWVRVANHIAPDPKQVIPRLTQALIDYNVNQEMNIAKRVALVHVNFEHIHPFVDGNGRIGRVINNYLLIREGYVPINIKYVNRSAYYEALREFDREGRTKKMEEMVGRAITNSYHKRLAYLEGKEIITLSNYAKRKRLSHSGLLNKAERQTIEAFTEHGIWKIGVVADQISE